MKFTPMTAEEIALAAMLNPGVYPFEVISATDEISKAGNEMIKIKLAVFGPEGSAVHVYDYLMEKLAYKLLHCAEVCGLLARYEGGELEAVEFVGRSGYVKLDVDNGGNGYLPKNVVKDYVTPEQAKKATPSRPLSAVPPLNPAPGKAATPESLRRAGFDGGTAPFDDSIPF